MEIEEGRNAGRDRREEEKKRADDSNEFARCLEGGGDINVGL